MNSTGQPLRLILSSSPSSFDPLEFDVLKNHPIQSILNTKLVSIYKNSQVSPELASSWRSSEADKTWEFTIRSDVRFLDGSVVTPEVVEKSLRRAAFLQKKSSSKSTFVRELKGIEDMASLDEGPIEGIEARGDKLVLRFKKSVPNLLEILSFGIYGIVDPKNFESHSGKWIAAVSSRYNSSGPYRVSESSDLKMILVQKTDFPRDLVAAKSFRKIEVEFGKPRTRDCDLVIGADDLASQQSGMRFFGREATNTLYAFVHSWNSKGHVLQSRINRLVVRETFLKAVSDSGMVTTHSFFPLAMKGVAEPQLHLINFSNVEPLQGSVSFTDLRPSGSAAFDRVTSAFEASLANLGLFSKPIKNVRIEELRRLKDPNLKDYPIDIAFYSTGVDIADPESDIRLMFSNEGIRLPDPTGKIHLELLNRDPDIQRINQQLNDDGIVWPIRHYSLGFWASSRVDVSYYDTHRPLGELQWLSEL
jgi:Bacterial extracellular solute-binding proteins, family 5 Middle